MNGYNRIFTFTPDDESAVRVALSVEGDWIFSAGLQPNVNRAVVTYKEFDKLAGKLDRVGSIGVWFENDPAVGGAMPDFTIDKVRIIDVLPSRVGEPLTGAARVVEYVLLFSDFRDGFTAPRGGRLELGLINPSNKKKPAQSAQSAPGQTPPPDPKTKTNSELILACLKAMGLDSVYLESSISAAADAKEAPKDLKWLGSHAPSELAKLLDRCNLVFCPQLAGDAKIQQIGTGAAPQIPAGRALPELRLDGIDRRGKVVVITSYPNQIANTLTSDDVAGNSSSNDPNESAAGWRFVYPSGDGQWKLITDSSLPFGGNPEQHVRDDFKNIAEKDREMCRAMAYRYVQLNPDDFDPDVQPLMRQVWQDDGTVGDITFKAKIAVQGADGKWTNATDFVSVPVAAIFDGNVILVGARLGKLKSGVSSSSDPSADFAAISEAEMDIRFSVGDATFTQEADQELVKPAFFKAGFRQKLGGAIEELQDADIDSAISDRDTVTLAFPELLQLRFESEEKNVDELKKKAKELAPAYLKGSDQPTRVLTAVGLLKGELDGLVSEIRWNQRELTTTYTLNNWWRPSGKFLLDDERRRLQAGETHPFEAKTKSERTALGQAGAKQPSVPVQPVQIPSPAPTPIYDIRFSSGWLQASYKVNPSESDWVNKIAFEAC